MAKVQNKKFNSRRIFGNCYIKAKEDEILESKKTSIIAGKKELTKLNEQISKACSPLLFKLVVADSQKETLMGAVC